MLLSCIPRDCLKYIIKTLEEAYKLKLYEYNSLISKWRIKLKPVHIVCSRGKKYVYLGRYWYRVEYSSGKLKWVYLGKEKPFEHLPDPPLNPLDMVATYTKGGDVCIEIPDDIKPEVVIELLKALATS